MLSTCRRLFLIVSFVLAAPAITSADVWWYAAYDFATTTAYSNFFSHPGQCNSPTCSLLPTPNGATAQVNSSDVGVAQEILIFGVPDGDVVSWEVTKPDNSTVFLYSLSYDQATDCFTGSDGHPYCGGNDNLDFVTIANTSCSCTTLGTGAKIGSWSLTTYENGVALYTNPFTISHSPNGFLGVTSPTDNQLFQLVNGNYNATGSINFSAGTSTGNPVSWTANLHYQSSGGHPNPATDPTPLTFSGTSYNYAGYQSIGGQVQVTAQTAASDGSTVQDCVTFYVEGVQSTSPLDPTNQLLTLYSTGATPRLMTGLAEVESGYNQFLYPGQGNPVQPNLFNGIQGLWPRESWDGGSHIGLLMVPTTDALAWDWLQNTSHGVNSTADGFAGQKLPTATNIMNWLITGKSATKQNQLPGDVPAHVNLAALSNPSSQLENMALVDYGPSAASLYWAEQYYIPVCPSGNITNSTKGWNCNNSTWYWAVNDPDVDANVVASKIFPPGIDTSTAFTNADGISYADSVRSACIKHGGSC